MDGVFALELSAMVRRAARHGRLDPYDLLDSYVQLAPSGHAELGNARRLDLAALVSALQSLPAMFADVGRVMVVPRLAAYSHTPLPGPGPAGLLPDGTLLVEARLGELSLLGLAAAVCAITHELDKARALLPVDEEDLAEDDAPGEDTLVQIGGVRRTYGPTEGAREEQDAPPADEPWVPRLALGELAFTLGVDEAALRAADQATDGTLRKLLHPQWELPELLLHAELELGATARRAKERHQRILAAAAELGLAGRPLHVFIGPSVTTDCLSPYTRDLREPLLAWAARRGDALPADLADVISTPSEDVLYALGHELLHSDARLVGERLSADRTVGIQRLEQGGLPFELVDLARIEPRVCDARLGDIAPSQEGAVLLRLSLDLEDARGEGLRELLTTCAGQLRSVTVVLDGTALEAPAGTVLLPSALVSWAGEHLISLAQRHLDPAELSGLTVVTSGGTVFSLPHASLLSTDRVATLARTHGVRAVAIGAADLVESLAQLGAGGCLPDTLELAVGVVASYFVTSGRPSVPTLTGHSAFAIALLRRILRAPPGKSAPAKKERPRPSSGRAVRLKA